MDSGVLAITATAVGGLIGFATATLTSWMNLRQARLQGEQHHDNETRRWRAERLASAYEELSRWLTDIFHAVQHLQLRETWRDSSAPDDDRDFGEVIKGWLQGPLRMPNSAAATRVFWSYATRHSIVGLEQQIELYIARAFERDDDPEGDWLQSMYDGKDEILYAIDRTLIAMRQELYGPDATTPAPTTITQPEPRSGTGPPSNSS